MKAYDTRRTGANMDSISYLMRAGHECTMPTQKANDRGNNFSLFSLGTPRTFLLKAVETVPTFQDKRRLVHIAKEIQTSIARYLVPVKVDDPESCSHISIISFLGLALGRSTQAAIRTHIGKHQDFFCDRVDSLTQLGEFLGD
jgi:hypothetical protein